MTAYPLPPMRWRFESLQPPDPVLLWYRFGEEPEQGPVELDEVEFRKLLALFEQAAAVVSDAQARGARAATGQRYEPLHTDPFALRPRREDE